MCWAFGEWVPDDDLLSRGIPRTIIGVLLFHGPVRDGKGWGQQAKVVKHWQWSGIRRQGSGISGGRRVAEPDGDADSCFADAGREGKEKGLSGIAYTPESEWASDA